LQTYDLVIEPLSLLGDDRSVLLDESGDTDGDVELVRVRVGILADSKVLDLVVSVFVVLLKTREEGELDLNRNQVSRRDEEGRKVRNEPRARPPPFPS